MDHVEIREQPPIGALTRPSPVLALGDSLQKAANLLRRSSFDAVPVVQDGQVIGMVTETSLRRAGMSVCSSPLTVAGIMSRLVTGVPAYVTPEVALQVLDANLADTMPVTDYHGMYRGMVSRADVLQALDGVTPPERIGGMATPLGVYLTSGSARGGVGDVGLFLAGIALFFCMALATAVVFAIAWLVNPDAAVNLAFAATGIDGQSPPWAWAAIAAAVGLIFRASPLAAYHGAEHQVVNAIERGEDLTPERVAKMPRVHPRCGTNLVVIGMTATAIVTYAGGGAEYVVLAVLIGLALRFVLGGLAQHFITTKRPGDVEVASGIKAARQLIERHQRNLGKPVGFHQRLWSTGLVQVALGLMVPMWLLMPLLSLLGVRLPF